QVGGRVQPVAAVVPAAGQNQHAASGPVAFPQHLGSGAGQCVGGAAHQRHPCCQRAALGGADVLGAVSVHAHSSSCADRCGASLRHTSGLAVPSRGLLALIGPPVLIAAVPLYGTPGEPSSFCDRHGGGDSGVV